MSAFFRNTLSFLLRRKWLAILILILAVLASLIWSYFHHIATYDTAPVEAMVRAGYTEKQVTLPDGTRLNYGEGPANGKPALLLIHGQGVIWQDYAPVLPALAQTYHVYAVDCHGHGKSSWDTKKYTAEAMSADFAWFIENVIKQPVVISGHSSGGMLAAYVAATAPADVKALVIEDSPFFSTEPGEREKTYAFIYNFEVNHAYLQQSEEPDRVVYYMQHMDYFRKAFGPGLWDQFTKDVTAFRKANPEKTVKLWYAPASINRIWETMSYPYDPLFGETFYDNSWFKNFDQAAILARITVPTTYIKASTNHDGEMLMAALSEEDVQRALSLIKGSQLVRIEGGHDTHFDSPQKFVDVLVAYAGK